MNILFIAPNIDIGKEFFEKTGWLDVNLFALNPLVEQTKVETEKEKFPLDFELIVSFDDSLLVYSGLKSSSARIISVKPDRVDEVITNLEQLFYVQLKNAVHDLMEDRELQAGPCDTVCFVITSGESTFPRAVRAVGEQDIPVQVDVIQDVKPMSAAFQTMLTRVEASYPKARFILQVDADMILFPRAARTLAGYLKTSPDSVAGVCAYLWDEDLKRKIHGIKAYKVDKLLKSQFRDVQGCEMDLIRQWEILGYSMTYIHDVLGLHGTCYTEETIWHRYHHLASKEPRNQAGFEKIIQFSERPEAKSLLAFLGFVDGILRPVTDRERIGIQEVPPKFNDLRNYLAIGLQNFTRFEGPKVSVILPIHNGERFILDCLTSLRQQVYHDFEVISVFNGCTDNSLPKFLAFVEETKDERFRYIFLEEANLVKALNTGILSGAGPYIARQDVDDLSDPYRLLFQVSYLDQHPDVHVLGTWAKEIDENGKFIRTHDRPSTYQEIQDYARNNTPLTHGSVFIRREVFKILGRYSTDPRVRHAEDYEFWLRCLRSGFQLEALPFYLYLWRNVEKAVSNQHVEEQCRAVCFIRGMYPELLEKTV